MLRGYSESHACSPILVLSLYVIMLYAGNHCVQFGLRSV